MKFMVTFTGEPAEFKAAISQVFLNRRPTALKE